MTFYTVITHFEDKSVGKIEGLTENDVVALVEGTLSNIAFTSITITITKEDS